MLELRDFSYARQVFDKMLERVFIYVLWHFTYIEKWGQLSSIGGEDGYHLYMRIVQILIRFRVATLVVWLD